jgi:hypothetical protein
VDKCEDERPFGRLNVDGRIKLHLSGRERIRGIGVYVCIWLG